MERATRVLYRVGAAISLLTVLVTCSIGPTRTPFHCRMDAPCDPQTATTIDQAGWILAVGAGLAIALVLTGWLIRFNSRAGDRRRHSPDEREPR